MAKGVLGNDPFKRGAASRPSESGAPETPPAEAAPKKPAKGKAASPKAGGKAASAASRKPEPRKAPGKARGGKAAAADNRRKGAKAQGAAPASAPPHAAPARSEPREELPATSARGAKTGAPAEHEGFASAAEEAALPLREPAAATEPIAEGTAAGPVNEAGPRTDSQREVDHALTEALASEVAEASATAAVEEALGGEAGQDADVERLMATEMATELAESAVEALLEQGPPSQLPEQERELAVSVAAQVAEAAARAAADEMRSIEAAQELMAEAPGTQGAPEASSTEEASAEATWTHEASVSVLVTEESDTTAVEPEVELPDATRDEFPPGRRGPLSLVPPPASASAEDAARDAFPPDAGRSSHENVRPLAERAVAALSLARDIAGQALASESLGRALLAVSGLKDMVRAGLGTGGGANLDEYGKDPALVERLEPVLEFLYSQYWRVAVQGVVHVPQGAAILVANHSGALPYDGLVMSMALTRERPDLREPRWLVEDQVFHAPVLGTLFNRLGAVRACPENALRLLDEHRPLVVFPEGYQALSKPFGERYRLKRFGRGGFVKLALRTGAPIVPVAIVGAEETSPLLGRIPASFLGLPYVPLTPLGPLPLPAKWSIRFGEPIGVEDFPPEAADDLGEVQRLTERTREAIQSMLQSLLRERRSVFAG
ncbi:1-acyl-sn-glycerol-3-phosphate acyltransferase [Myxococcus sp. Y35]|uniref:1-acyl-sn-glycerol-3-phosphate acyltransferase n=1 Tax=Pseudomyxococcus flavus TaxID=3115648 RepID=UPI003CF4D4A1